MGTKRVPRGMSKLTSLSGAPLAGAPRNTGDKGSSLPSFGGLPSTGPSLLPKPGGKPALGTSDFGAIDSLFEGTSVKKKPGLSKPNPKTPKPLAQHSGTQQSGFDDFPVSRGLLKNPIGRGKPKTKIPKKEPEISSKIPAKKVPALDPEGSESSCYDDDSFSSEIVAVAPAHPSPTRGAPTQQNPTTPIQPRQKEVQEREAGSAELNVLEEEEEDPSVSKLLSYFQDTSETSKKTGGESKPTSTGQNLNLHLFGPGTSRPSSGGRGRRGRRNDQSFAQSDSELEVEGEGRGEPGRAPSRKSNWSADVLEAEDVEEAVLKDPIPDKGLVEPMDGNVAGRRAGRPNTPDPIVLAKGNTQEALHRKVDRSGKKKQDDFDFDWELDLGLLPEGANELQPPPFTKEVSSGKNEKPPVGGQVDDFVVVDDDLGTSSVSSSTESDDNDTEVGSYVPSFLSPPAAAFSSPQAPQKEMKSNLPIGGSSTTRKEVSAPGGPKKRSVIDSTDTLGIKKEAPHTIGAKKEANETSTTTTDTGGFKINRGNRVSKLPPMEDKAPEVSEVQSVILAAKARREALWKHMEEKGQSESNKQNPSKSAAAVPGKIEPPPKLVEETPNVSDRGSTVSKRQLLLESPSIHNGHQRPSKGQQSSGGVPSSIPRLPSSSQQSEINSEPNQADNASLPSNGGPLVPTLSLHESAETITNETGPAAGGGRKESEGLSENAEGCLQGQDVLSTAELTARPLTRDPSEVRKEGKGPGRDVHGGTDAAAGADRMDEEAAGRDAGSVVLGRTVHPVKIGAQRDELEASLLVTAQNTWKEIEALASSAVAREKEVSSFLSGELPERGRKLDLRERLVMERERALEKRERGLDALKNQIIEVLERLEKTAGQDRDELEGERVRLVKEHSRLDAFYKALEDDRADVRQQLELERKLVESAREERRQERKTMLGELHAERVRLAEERAEALNSLRALQQEEMETRRRISELEAMAAIAHRAADEEEARLNFIKGDLESRKQTIESSREEMQKEAQMLSSESERVSEALGFVDVKMQELRDLTQDVPNMMLELNEAQKKLQEEWMECATQQEALENERRALAMEKESVGRQREELELRHQQMCLEREALNSAAADARQAKQKLSETVQLMSSEGLTTQVHWDSAECKLSIQGNQASSPRNKSIAAVDCDGVEEGLDQILCENGGGTQKCGISNQTKRARRNGGRNRNSQNSLRKMLGRAGVDLKQLEQEAKKSNVHLSSQVAFLQQAQSSDGFRHISRVDKSACGLPSNLSVRLRDIDLGQHQRYLPTRTQSSPIHPINSIFPSDLVPTVNTTPSPEVDHQKSATKMSKLAVNTLAPPCFTPLLNAGSTTDSFEGVEPEGL